MKSLGQKIQGMPRSSSSSSKKKKKKKQPHLPDLLQQLSTSWSSWQSFPGFVEENAHPPDKELYVCDMLAYKVLLRNMQEEEPLALGRWARCQSDENRLYLCTEVIPAGWELWEPESGEEIGTPENVQMMLKANDAYDPFDDTEICESTAAYLQAHAFVEHVPARHLRQFVTGNSRFLEKYMGTAERLERSRHVIETVAGAGSTPIPVLSVWDLSIYD